VRRREFIMLVGAAALARSPPARAQQPGRMHRVAYLASTLPVSEMGGAIPIDPAARVFVHGLRELGYVEGTNLVLEWRSAEGRSERFSEIVRELASSKVDVIVTSTNAATRAAKAVTTTIPIIMASSVNPVEEGLIQSLARPGANITGLTSNTGPEIHTKQVQLLKEILPGISRLAYLQPKEEMLAEWEQIAAAINRELGVQVLLAEHTSSDFAAAFALIARERPDALLIGASAANYVNRLLIAEFAAQNRLPAMYFTRDYVEAGGLMAYGAELADRFRRLASYVDQILKGAKPADLPVEQPTKFRLTINLKTAKALGIIIPPTLIARADEVIE
jgi:putative ABC transport system substrate-binding protein